MASMDNMRTRYHITVIVLLLTLVVYFLHMHFSVYRQSIHLSDIFVVEKPLQRPFKSTFIHLNGSIKHIAAVEQIYIINLPYRQDRRTGSIALFQTLDLDALIVPAYSVRSPEVVSRTHLVYKSHLRLIELACWASHLQLWLEVAATQNDSWALIFEDDIDLEMSTVAILQSFPSDLWNIPDLIYLGYCGNPAGALIYEGIQGYRVHKAIHPSCTHAYAIRSRSATKLIHLLSSPRKAIDDTIVDLVNDEQIVAFSIHPPLALQQSITSTHLSDVNPVQNTLIYKMNRWINWISNKWNGVEDIDNLTNSALTRSDFIKADEWRRKHESGIWQTEYI